MNEIAIESVVTVEGTRKPHLTVSLDRLASLLREGPTGCDTAAVMALVCRAAAEARGGDSPLAEAEAAKYEAEAWPEGKRYVTTWRNKFLCTGTTSHDEFIATLAGAVATLTEWKARGVLFDPQGGTRDDYATFYTHDAALAAELGFQDESEWYRGDDDDRPDDGGGEDVAVEDRELTAGQEGSGWDRPDQRDFL